jgi:hypothetical protein
VEAVDVVVARVDGNDVVLALPEFAKDLPREIVGIMRHPHDRDTALGEEVQKIGHIKAL